MAPRSEPPQLPRSARGGRLCRHRVAGSCTWFCQYALFAKVVVGIVLVLGVVWAAIGMGTAGGAAVVRDAGVAVGIYLAVVVPLIVVLNRRSPPD